EPHGPPRTGVGLLVWGSSSRDCRRRRGLRSLLHDVVRLMQVSTYRCYPVEHLPGAFWLRVVHPVPVSVLTDIEPIEGRNTKLWTGASGSLWGLLRQNDSLRRASPSSGLDLGSSTSPANRPVSCYFGSSRTPAWNIPDTVLPARLAMACGTTGQNESPENTRADRCRAKTLSPRRLIEVFFSGVFDHTCSTILCYFLVGDRGSVQCVNQADNAPAESCSFADKPPSEQSCDGAPCTTESEAAEFRVCVDELTYQECQNFKHLCDTKATPYFRLKCCHTCSLYLNRTFNE
ncbi:A disintegrin and metalloproteinase with thrombospondin motifs 7-like, partial [Tropilaelaps mercedesae]